MKFEKGCRERGNYKKLMGYGLDFRGGVKREYGRRRKETLGGGEGCNLRGVAGKGEIVKSKWVTG